MIWPVTWPNVAIFLYFVPTCINFDKSRFLSTDRKRKNPKIWIFIQTAILNSINSPIKLEIRVPKLFLLIFWLLFGHLFHYALEFRVRSEILWDWTYSLLTWVTGSFMIRTSVTVPNIPKYSLSFSLLVCHDKPPTNNFPGAGSPPFGVLLPELPEWLPFIGTRALWKSCSIAPFASIPALKHKRQYTFDGFLQTIYFFFFHIFNLVIINI